MRVGRGLRADEKIDTPITQLLGKHDLVTNCSLNRVGWSTYTTSTVSPKGAGTGKRDIRSYLFTLLSCTCIRVCRLLLIWLSYYVLR
jgi:hypothetical protein